MQLAQDEILLQVKDLKKHFPIERGLFKTVVGYVKAVDGVSFYIKNRETLGLVGESGCGKTTTGRCILQATGAPGWQAYAKADRACGALQAPR